MKRKLKRGNPSCAKDVDWLKFFCAFVPLRMRIASNWSVYIMKEFWNLISAPDAELKKILAWFRSILLPSFSPHTELPPAMWVFNKRTQPLEQLTKWHHRSHHYGIIKQSYLEQHRLGSHDDRMDTGQTLFCRVHGRHTELSSVKVVLPGLQVVVESAHIMSAQFVSKDSWS